MDVASLGNQHGQHMAVPILCCHVKRGRVVVAQLVDVCIGIQQHAHNIDHAVLCRHVQGRVVLVGKLVHVRMRCHQGPQHIVVPVLRSDVEGCLAEIIALPRATRESTAHAIHINPSVPRSGFDPVWARLCTATVFLDVQAPIQCTRGTSLSVRQHRLCYDAV